MKRITGRLTEKNGKWYAVINLYTPEGKRKEKWCGLHLESKKGTKKEAICRLNEILFEYNGGALYLQENLNPAEREKYRIAAQALEDYLYDWLENYKYNIAILTYNSYKSMIDTRITQYFHQKHILLKELTGNDLNAFYIFMRNEGLTGATVQRYHSMLHLALHQALKQGIIAANPCDEANRPKAVPYIGACYNAEEIKHLINCFDGDPMRIAVILAAYYGLRRSEVLGLKWDAVDWNDNKLYIRHKIIENKREGNRLEGYDVMKSKSSYRSMPLIPFIRDVLLEEKKRQEEMKRILRGTYNKAYSDYICVDAIGNLIKPQYVTAHFKVILKRNGLKEIRFHDLRHSCASLLLGKNINMKVIQMWLGHSNMSTTAEIYSHLDSSAKNEAGRAIASMLGLNDESEDYQQIRYQ